MMTQRSTMINALLMLAVIGCTSIQAFQQGLAVEINPDSQMAVRLGQSQTILCKLPVALKVCRIEIPGEQILVLSQGQPVEDGISYYGEGLDKGHCGVSISSIQDKHDGNVTCYLTPNQSRTESSNTVRMIVARPPRNPQLILNKNSPYKSGEKMAVSCIAEGGKPPANVTLYLDNEAIGVEERPMIYGRRSEENINAELNMSRSVTPSDNGKTLRCVASHIALPRPLETSRPIEVYFPPQPQQTIQGFGYAIGRPGKVNVTVHANPMPSFTWNVDSVKINAGQPDITGRLQTSSAVDLGRGYWSVELNIDSVQKSDTDKMYSLEAHNSEGFHKYDIILSSASEPAGVDLDAGSIIGIVIGVLLLILAVFLIVFARATGRWCFAARRRSDEEAAGGAGAGSEAHITPGSDEDDDQHEHEQHIISDEKKSPSQHGQENPIHASTEYVNGRNDINSSNDIKKDLEVKKTDTRV